MRSGSLNSRRDLHVTVPPRGYRANDLPATLRQLRHLRHRINEYICRLFPEFTVHHRIACKVVKIPSRSDKRDHAIER